MAIKSNSELTTDISSSIVDNTEGLITPGIVRTLLTNVVDSKAHLDDITNVESLLAEKADLVDGKIPSSQLPSYVDAILEFANLASFPVTGATNKLYVAQDSGLVYRWTGTVYVSISSALALGETSSTAYRGDRGKTAYDHSQLTSGNPHSVTKSNVGLGNVDNTSDANKPVSTATQTALNSKVSSDTTGITGADQITNMVSLTQSEYDAIGSKNASTLYIISG